MGWADRVQAEQVAEAERDVALGLAIGGVGWAPLPERYGLSHGLEPEDVPFGPSHGALGEVRLATEKDGAGWVADVGYAPDVGVPDESSLLATVTLRSGGLPVPSYKSALRVAFAGRWRLDDEGLGLGLHVLAGAEARDVVVYEATYDPNVTQGPPVHLVRDGARAVLGPVVGIEATPPIPGPLQLFAEVTATATLAPRGLWPEYQAVVGLDAHFHRGR